ncbi:MAG: glycosyltransferase family 39 protein [Patescibacteria group bacterium]|nr:glycosyltransferase family 39 protein [Patescibacteria group bacterium]
MEKRLISQVLSMKKKFLRKIIKKYWLLTGAVFLLIFLSRFAFLGADLLSPTLEVEEKFGGYSARNMIFLERSSAYFNWLQSMVYLPLQNFFSYLSFLFFGVGLSQFRLPMVIGGFLGTVFFYLIFLKQTNPFWAIVAIVFYAFNLAVTLWQRSALTENLYFFLMPLSVYFIIKDDLKSKDIFAFVFFAALNFLVKIDSYPFYLAAIIFLLFWPLKTISLARKVKIFLLASLSVLVIGIILFMFFDAFKFISSYQIYLDVLVKRPLSFAGVMATAKTFISIFLGFDPFIFLAFSTCLPILLIQRRILNKVDIFFLIFSFLNIITRLQVPADAFSWKRILPLFFASFYIIFRALYFLGKNDWLPKKTKPPKDLWFDLSIVTFFGTLILPIYFIFFQRSIFPLFTPKEYPLSFNYSPGLFIYFLFLITVMVISLGGLVFIQNQKFKLALRVCLTFLVLVSGITNFFSVFRLYLPDNIRYSYRENKKYSALIPENETIIAHEQAFRAWAYLSKHDFYFNHDGGPNPIPYREALERKDIRYFIINADDFWDERWGITNKTRLAVLKEVYPNLKPIGVFFASNVWLTIYDKYSNKQ